jgi:hypothetical protein
MTTPTEIALGGTWPAGVAAGLTSLLGGQPTVLEERATLERGMLPWADIASLVSAAAAAITVGLVIWDRRSAARRAEKADHPPVDELDRHVKQQGIFGVSIEQVAIDPARSECMTVQVYHGSSGRQFQFEMSDANASLLIRVVSGYDD